MTERMYDNLTDIVAKARAARDEDAAEAKRLDGVDPAKHEAARRRAGIHEVYANRINRVLGLLEHEDAGRNLLLDALDEANRQHPTGKLLERKFTMTQEQLDVLGPAIIAVLRTVIGRETEDEA